RPVIFAGRGRAHAAVAALARLDRRRAGAEGPRKWALGSVYISGACRTAPTHRRRAHGPGPTAMRPPRSRRVPAAGGPGRPPRPESGGWPGGPGRPRVGLRPPPHRDHRGERNKRKDMARIPDEELISNLALQVVSRVAPQERDMFELLRRQ